MKCPNCGAAEMSVQDTRASDDEVRRRRVCTVCTHRYVSVEKIVDVYIPAKPGPKPGSEMAPRKEKPVQPKRGREALNARAKARRRLEEIADDKSIYDDLHDVRDIWQR